MSGQIRRGVFLNILVTLLACAPRVPPHGVPIRVALSGDASEVIEVPLERYVAGVLEKEVISTWPIEALKAQAVASRTYALYRREHPRDEAFDVVADIIDQVFENRRRYPPSIVQAVRETEGEVLLSEGKIFSAFFHSCCGGTSERGDAVWEGVREAPLLSRHEDPYCSACPHASWEYRIPREELGYLLTLNGYSVGEDLRVKKVEKDESGRVSRITFRSREGEISLPGTAFREMVGYTNLKSTLFEAVEEEEGLLFSGRGFGHGVGLCQWGAKGMADQGQTYQEILEFYYPGAELWTSPSSTTNSQESSSPNIPSPDVTTPE